jgi:two-component system response regulator AtoC
MTVKPRILLIDDNETFLELFLALPEINDFEIVPLTSAEIALEILNTEIVDLIISDIQMPDMSGIELFDRVQDLYPEIPVILVTAFGSTELAIQTVKRGAFHYFEKPINDKLDLFWATVREALAKREMLKELALLLKEKNLQTKTFSPIIGRSEAICKVLQSIKEVADLPATVMICGETGTGKELVARAVHDLSTRNHKPFFAVNCNEFAPGVLESELFGHERGSFTGATERNNGLFEIAHHGTLFLDEISNASPFFQSKLLRVVETKTFTRVGGTTPIFSDFRLITATNRNMEDEVAKGRFRQDLFYRLNVYRIEVPPLRNRREDIPLITEYYLKKFSQAYHRSINGLSERALLSLMEYDWPGNVRELINIMERAVITCKETRLTSRHFPFDTASSGKIVNFNLKEIEKIYINLALRQADANKSKAAQLLGINRKTLIEKVRKYGL